MKERENQGFEIDKSFTAMHPRVVPGLLKNIQLESRRYGEALTG